MSNSPIPVSNISHGGQRNRDLWNLENMDIFVQTIKQYHERLVNKRERKDAVWRDIFPVLSSQVCTVPVKL